MHSNKNFSKKSDEIGDMRISAFCKLLQYLGLPILQPQPVKIFENRQRNYVGRHMEL